MRRSGPAGGADPAAVAAALAALGPLGVADGPLGALTTYRVGGPAAVVATARRLEDLDTVRDAAAASGLPLLVVGRGSNLLVADAGFGGIAVVLDPDAFGAVEVLGAPGAPGETGAAGAGGAIGARRATGAGGGGPVVVRAGAAVPLPALARRSVEAGLHGLEWAVGVPGSVGGGVRMNAGGHGSDIAASFVRARVAALAGAGGVRTVDLAALAPGYRRSAIQPGEVVLDAEFALRPADPDAGRRTIRDIVRWRREHQPGGQNAGSVFVNPVHTAVPPSPVPPSPVPPSPVPPSPVLALPVAPGSPDQPTAGWLVEAAGCKGRRHGTAEVSAKHANFIQADPGGSADDVHALIGEVRRAVADRFGTELRTEIRMIGFPQPSTSGGGVR